MKKNKEFLQTMKSKLDLKNAVLDCLKQLSPQKKTRREIGLWILEHYPEQCATKYQNSKAKNPKKPIEQLTAEMVVTKAWEKAGIRVVSSIRPLKLYFTTQTDEEQVQQAEAVITTSQIQKEQSFSEHDLYPLLAEYLQTEFEIYSKRIDEKRSSNNNGSRGNQWLHPDLVGLQDLSQDWHSEIKQCVKAYSDKQTKLWSFEVKILLNRSNVRESFFQTVSNSAWANFSYLVASRIDGKDTLKELRLLSALHGVGIIQLDVENPNESQIIIPARESNDVDWDATNRLVEENKDFQEYIELIREFYQTGKIRKENWRIQ